MAKYLSLIERLPDEFTEDLQWLFDAVKSERMTQLDILDAFNSRIHAKGGRPISQSALNRYVQKVRNGGVRRPIDGSLPAGEGGILIDSFREQLTAAIGENAVRAQETALAALCRKAGQ